jgi:hypothetical protein
MLSLENQHIFQAADEQVISLFNGHIHTARLHFEVLPVWISITFADTVLSVIRRLVSPNLSLELKPRWQIASTPRYAVSSPSPLHDVLLD